jgi:coenzyme F420 hydrogenase subunit beta
MNYFVLIHKEACILRSNQNKKTSPYSYRAVNALSKIPKVSFEETLGKHVLPSLCIGCGTCIVVCPFNCLEYVKERPILIKECKLCGICSQICPRYEPSTPRLEQLVFNRERRPDEEFGIYRRLVIAQIKDDKIRQFCQDGGIVTALLIHALEKGEIDSAALSCIRKKEPLRAIPRLATTKTEILECAGTRYTYSPSIFSLKEAFIQNKKSLAFVGTPCQIQAIRKMQVFKLKKYTSLLKFTVGVFCSKCFTYEGLVNEYIQGKLGIHPSEVDKINIKGRMLLTTKSNELKSIPLTDVKKFTNNCVVACSDFSAELADISVGGVGLKGWTLIILRTEKGEEVFLKALLKGLIRTKSVETEKKMIDLLLRLSKMKRKNAIK